MTFSNWLRGVATVTLTDINKVFVTAGAALAASVLPAPLKVVLAGDLAAAEDYINSLEVLAGTLGGEAIADGVDDVTTLLLNTRNNIVGAKSLSYASKAELASLQVTWSTMKAQGDTLVAQFLAGVDPTAASVPSSSTSNATPPNSPIAQANAPPANLVPASPQS